MSYNQNRYNKFFLKSLGIIKKLPKRYNKKNNGLTPPSADTRNDKHLAHHQD